MAMQLLHTTSNMFLIRICVFICDCTQKKYCSGVDLFLCLGLGSRPRQTPEQCNTGNYAYSWDKSKLVKKFRILRIYTREKGYFNIYNPSSHLKQKYFLVTFKQLINLMLSVELYTFHIRKEFAKVISLINHCFFLFREMAYGVISQKDESVRNTLKCLPGNLVIGNFYFNESSTW